MDGNLSIRDVIRAAMFLTGSALLCSPADAQNRPSKPDASFRVVGYLPDYRVEAIDLAIGRYLTDLVYFSVKPEPQGHIESKVLDDPKTRRLLKQVRDAHGVKIHLCVGGWDRSQGFAGIASTPMSRRLFATGLTKFCRDRGFDGADIDWEHPKDDVEAKNYGALLAEIARAFKPHRLRLTAATAAWQTLTPEGLAAIDSLHLMSYDAPQRHSTFEAAQSDIEKFLKLGVPASKLCLGLPFYGRGIADGNQVKTYAEILAAGTLPPDSDEVAGLYFNGPSTIQKKARLAVNQKLSGVMIWEIGQDGKGDASLLKLISETVPAR